MEIWKKAVSTGQIPPQTGAALKFGEQQIALFHYEQDAWYAVQNCCPQDGQMTLSRGIVGDCKGEAKIACPLYKHTFSLETGNSLSEPDTHVLKTYPTKIENGVVFVQLEV